MRADQRSAGQTFGPDSLKAMGKAFDELWEEIAESFGNQPGVIEAARLALAEAVLAVASDESLDVGSLKTAAHRLTVLRGGVNGFSDRGTGWSLQAMPSSRVNL
jgi:hypothetical protein